MNFASKQAYIKCQAPSSQQTEIKQEQKQQESKALSSRVSNINYSDEELEVDTNVFEIGFNFLKKDKENLALGDPVVCSKCQAFLNKYSQIVKAVNYLNLGKKKEEVHEESEKQMEKVEQISSSQQKLEKKDDVVLVGHVDDQLQDLEENDQVWICEFCGNHNQIRIEPEEVPTQEDVIYILPGESVESIGKENKNSDISIIFCIDFSGSMSATTEVKGNMNLKHGLTPQEMEMLKQFIEPGAENQWYAGKKANTTFVSRKQCVVAAIETQIQELKKANPNRNVGLVIFNDEVVIIGDGTKEPIFIAGDKLGKYDEILAVSTGSVDQIQKTVVKDAADNLTAKLSKMQEKGRTALGPGLLAALGLASQGKPGSMVILCTDGLANVGIGSLDGSQDPKDEFYAQTAAMAKDKGLVISIITIKGEGCNIESLTKLVDQTNGNVTRVNPSDIGKDFAAVLQDEVVATQVNLTVRLNKLLNFRNEDPLNLGENGSVYQKDIGNATVNTKLTFQYTTKSMDELNAMGFKDISALQEVPFQSQIEYTNLEGKRLMRVLTNFQLATDVREQAEKEVDARILHKRVVQMSNQVMLQGDFQRANVMNQKWNQYIVENEGINSNQMNIQANEDFQQKNAHWRKAAGQKEKFTNLQKCMAPPIESSKKEEGFFDQLKSVFSSSATSSSSSSSHAPSAPVPNSYNNNQLLSKAAPKKDQKFCEEEMMSQKPQQNSFLSMKVEANFSDHDSASDDEEEHEAYFQQQKKK